MACSSILIWLRKPVVDWPGVLTCDCTPGHGTPGPWPKNIIKKIKKLNTRAKSHYNTLITTNNFNIFMTCKIILKLLTVEVIVTKSYLILLKTF